MTPAEREKFHETLKAGGWEGIWDTLQPGQASLALDMPAHDAALLLKSRCALVAGTLKDYC